jgi:N-acetyl-anhydromuramyl-L-alanine amidase AmpD
MSQRSRTTRRALLAIMLGTAAGTGVGVFGVDRLSRLARNAGVSPRQLLKKLRGAPAPTFAAKPGGIVVHHSATKPENIPYENVATINKEHAKRGMAVLYQGKIYNIAYHYVISHDGSVEKGRPERCRGSHTRSWKHNHWIGICLIGYFDKQWENPKYHEPTEEQMSALVDLCSDLMKRYGFEKSRILPHREVNDTECPGKNFPWKSFMKKLAEGENGAIAMKSG